MKSAAVVVPLAREAIVGLVERHTALAGPVLRHRMALSFIARADGLGVDDVIERLVARLG